MTFDRRRGIVWVCDLKDSTKLLNRDDTVDLVEDYLPRLYWLSRQFVESAGGEFIKWTGDGFLAWFDCKVERQIGRIASMVFNAAWHLSFTNNVTNLGVGDTASFALRHGIAWEPDALVMNTIDQSGLSNKDLLGRAVVFAFRLSGISVDFPKIVTERRLASESAKVNPIEHNFEQLRLTEEDILKHFKGEKRGISKIVASSQIKRRSSSSSKFASQIRQTMSKETGHAELKAEYEHFVSSFVDRCQIGPQWAREMIDLELRFLKDDMLAPLKEERSRLAELAERTSNDDFRPRLAALEELISQMDRVIYRATKDG